MMRWQKSRVLVSASSNYADIEFTLDPERTAAGSTVLFSGLLSVIPDNVFAALASNDSMQVLVFATIFGVGMVFSEKRSGYSVFGALAHIQEVCILIFDWFGVLVPLGIIVLVAPQIALLDSSAYAVLGLFCSAVLVVSGIVLLAAALTVSFVLRIPVGASMTSMLGPIILGAATRNTLVCIPSSLEALAGQLRLRREPCELYVPIGFALVQFGPIIYFAVAATFMGLIQGRSFSAIEIVLLAVFSVAASFGTLGLAGPAALIPLAAVLRPFGLSYELALPLLIIVEPIANMVRVPVNVAVNFVMPVLAVGRLRKWRSK